MLNNGLQLTLWRAAMVLAPFLITVAQFFWHNGLVGYTGGWLQVLAFVCWIGAFLGLFELLKEQYPTYVLWGISIAVYACVAGAGFGYDGIYTEAMGLTSIEEVNALHNEIGLPLIITLFLPGILFPLSLIGMGIQLIRAKQVAKWMGILLVVAAVGFPLSRIPRIDWLAHADNLLLLISHAAIAFRQKLGS